MSASATVSVVIPARNRRNAIAECIESVLAQTCAPMEVIVVDDTSEDDTAAVAARFKEVRVLRNDRSAGAQGARNTGIQHARGEWIAFLDSDDVWEPDRLAKQIALLTQMPDPSGFVIHSDGLVEHGSECSMIAMPEVSGDAYASLLLRPGPMFQGMLVHRDRLLAIGLLDERCPAYQEWDTAIRLARVARFIHVRSPLFRWRRHDGETISKDGARDFQGFHYVIEKHAPEILRVHGERALRRMQAGVLAHGLRLRRFPELLAMQPSPRPNLAFPLARACAKLQVHPPGIPTLLRLASLP